MEGNDDHATPPTACAADEGPPADSNRQEGDLPPELPLTPQSNNKAPLLGKGDGSVGDAVIASVPTLASLGRVGEDLVEALDSSISVSEAGGGTEMDKSYARNMSALSVSTGESLASPVEGAGAGEDGVRGVGGRDLPDTPKSSLVSGQKKKSPDSGGVEWPAKAVDWIPQQQFNGQQLVGDGSLSGLTSQAIKWGEDAAETSFTTITTVGETSGAVAAGVTTHPHGLDRVASDRGGGGCVGGGGGVLSPTPITSNGATRSSSRAVKTGYIHHPPAVSRGRTTLTSGLHHRGSVPSRSPRPPRHMRAVDWCPPSSSNSSLGVSSGASSSRLGAAGGAVAASDKTAVTSRAVRLGDDATVTTFATMTTMGDAGSILEADTEDEASSSSGDSGGSVGGDGGNNKDNEAEGGEDRTDGSMEDVRDKNGVVDKIPSCSNNKKHAGSLSGTTNHAVRASDDQSMVTFATSTTFSGGGVGVAMQQHKVVDKVPSFPPRTGGTSIVTNETVQMGDNQSLVTWATTNTMGGQLTGNVVDHVPADNTVKDEDGVAGVFSSNITMDTSKAVKDEPSVTTFSTLATLADSAINEVVDQIPTFAGGGGGTGRSVVSGVTNAAVRMGGGNGGGSAGGTGSGGGVVGGDDRSVASFATMTTMGDLGSIFETEVLPDDVADHGNRTNLFSAGDQYSEIDRAVVDVIPEASVSSVASGTADHSVGGEDRISVTTFGTMTTAGLRDAVQDREREAHNSKASMEDKDVVDKVPEGEAPSVVSERTDCAVRMNDGQSVATWATTATSAAAMTVVGHANEHLVDKIPSFRERSSDQSMISETTDHAVKDPEDQSVVTWNTMTTAGVGRPPPARSPPPPAGAQPCAVDRVPSFSNHRVAHCLSGTTNHTVRATDDQSVVTFATMTTVGGGIGCGNDIVDKVPSFTPQTTNASIVTNDTVQMGDNQSLATWATTNTMGGQLSGNVVDHVPFADDDEESNITLGTSNAVKEEPSIATFVTSATGRSGTNEVVDRIPMFAGGGGDTGWSVASGVTNRAVRMGDDRSVASFATMTTVGETNNAAYLRDVDNCIRSPGGGIQRYSGNERCPRSVNKLVDHIPSLVERGGAASIVSGQTNGAVRLGDDMTVTTFATMTTAGEEERGVVVGVSSEPSEDLLASASASLRFNAPTAGILREGRHGRPPSATRTISDSVALMATSADSVGGGDAIVRNGLPFDTGESVSNAHILRALADLRFHVDYQMGELRELNKRDSERILQIMHQEQSKRTALEARLHSQLLLQSESMVAMELKLIRLEAKVAQRDSRRQQQRARQVGGGGSIGQQQPGGFVYSGGTGTITDRLPPIAATPSTPNRSDEEIDSFEELELTPRGANRQGQGIGSGMYTHGGGMHRGGGPANIAVVTRSGASVASAVTATSFQEGDFSHAMNDDDGVSDDGDIEDEGVDNDDGSASTPTHSSRNRISNLESILLNPIPAAGGGTNDQGISTRAIRGPPDADGMSSLPTSVTSATMASTVVTSTTRGNESTVGVTRILSRASEEDVLREQTRNSLRSNSEDSLGHRPGHGRPRSRSQSPLTVQSAATATQSVGESASLGPSILSTAAVAPSRSFGTRRANAAAAIVDAEARPMANRVVSFTYDENGPAAADSNDATHPSEAVGPLPHQHPSDQIHQENDEGSRGMGDSITMPDELDNFSDVADAFSNSARVWREEYETRLDAIHKRLGG